MLSHCSMSCHVNCHVVWRPVLFDAASCCVTLSVMLCDAVLFSAASCCVTLSVMLCDALCYSMLRLTCSQCLSRIPGLQMICRSGRWTLNLSILVLTLSATLRGPGASLRVFESFKTVRNIVPISSSTSSALISVKGPGKRKKKC